MYQITFILILECAQAITSWIPDAAACARWAGPMLHFPFLASDLPELLAVAYGDSFSMTSAKGNMLGFGQFWPRDERTVHLGRIIVSPQYRGLGLGKILLELLIAKALTETKAVRITLRVYRDNQTAVSIYLRRGFSIIEFESNAEIFAMEAIVRQPLGRSGE